MNHSTELFDGKSNHVSETKLQTRSYQYEMFEKSMKGNVIIAMDTGSGKTHVAVLRIIAELERCPPDKVSILAKAINNQLGNLSLTYPPVCLVYSTNSTFMYSTAQSHCLSASSNQNQASSWIG
jgi:ATP-dependent helicase YprA (DUF1998 family)